MLKITFTTQDFTLFCQVKHKTSGGIVVLNAHFSPTRILHCITATNRQPKSKKLGYIFRLFV